MSNGWSGGQYSLVRILLGASLLVSFLLSLSASAGTAGRLLPSLLGAGCVLSLPVALGLYDRPAAVALMAVLIALAWPQDPGNTVGLYAYVVALLVHCLTPPAPYGSWAARGRVDPGGGWSMPPLVLLVARIAFGIVLVSIWIAPGGPGAFRFGVPLLLLLALDPAWIPRFHEGETDMLFYDGSCGLCHRAVRFVLAEDGTGSAFRFAALSGESFKNGIDERERERLPDSIVVRTAGGSLLVRSAATLWILRRLGGFWHLLGNLAGLLPASFRDAVYDRIAAIRQRVFARPGDTCPVPPGGLRSRFDP